MIWRLIVIVLLNFLFYWRTLKYFYVVDDVPAVVEGKHKIPVYKQIWHEISGSAHYNRQRTHLFTVLSHTFVCILIYLVFNRTDIAFMCALLFAVNPSNSQVSIWLSGKGYSLSAMAALVMYLCPILTPLLWYISWSYAATATLLFPFIFIRTSYWHYILLLIVLLFKYNDILARRHSKSHSRELVTIRPCKLILFVKSYGYYFMLGLFSFTLNLHHNILTGISLHKKYDEKNYALDKYFWRGLIILYIVITNIIFNWKNSFGFWWFSICIVQWCNLITIQTYIGERYLYLASVGLMYALTQFIMSFSYPVNIFIFIGFMIFYMTRLWFYMSAYKNDFFHIEYGLIEQWDNIRMRLFRARMKFRQHEYMGAYFDYMVLYKLYPWDFKVLYNLGMMSLALGKLPDAERFIKKAERNIYKNEARDTAHKLIAEARTTIEDTKLNNGVAVNRLNVLV